MFRCSLALLAAALSLAACSKPSPKKSADAETTAVLPANLFVDAAPEGALDIADLKAANPKQGDHVVIRGVVGGSLDPFVPGMAFFTLVGSQAKPCNATPDDQCPTPWDFCCESREALLANSASIRIIDSAGAALRAEVKGQRGIKELSELVVAGIVSQVGPSVLVIDAEQINVVKP